MIVSRVTAPTKEEGAEVDGGEEVGGVAVCVWGTHHEKIRRNRKGNGKMAKKPCDSGRKNELIISRHIPIDIYKG